MSGKSVQRKVVSGGSTSGRIATEYETPKYKKDVVPERTVSYAKPFVEKLKDEVWKVSFHTIVHFFDYFDSLFKCLRSIRDSMDRL